MLSRTFLRISIKDLRIWFQLLPIFWGPDHGEVLVVGTLILIMLALCISAAAHLRETERKEASEREEVMDRKKFNLRYCDEKTAA